MTGCGLMLTRTHGADSINLLYTGAQWRRTSKDNQLATDCESHQLVPIRLAMARNLIAYPPDVA